MTDFWCWTDGGPSTFRCRERGHDVRGSSPGGLTERQPSSAVTLADAWVALKNENTELLAKLNRLSHWHFPSAHPDETGLCGGCGERYPCFTRRVIDGEGQP